MLAELSFRHGVSLLSLAAMLGACSGMSGPEAAFMVVVSCAVNGPSPGDCSVNHVRSPSMKICHEVATNPVPDEDVAGVTFHVQQQSCQYEPDGPDYYVIDGSKHLAGSNQP
jgi:hypothetical protein